jgi:hypothetical protein
MYRRVDAHAEPGKTFLRDAESVETQLGLGELQPDPREADLLQEEQIIVGDARRIQAVRQFDIAGVFLADAPGGRLRKKRHRTGSKYGRKQLAPIVEHRPSH